MPLPIDTRTLCLASTASVLSLAAAMTYVWLRRKTYPGFGAWVGAAWCACLGMALLALRDLVSDALSIHGTNAMLYGSAILVLAGLRAFTGGQVPWRGYLLLMVALVGLNAVFLYFRPSLQLRVLLFSFVTGALCLRAAVLAWRELPRMLMEANGLVHGTLFGLALLYLVRGLATLAFPPTTQQFMAPSPIQAGALLGFLLGHATLFSGLIILNGQRVERDLQASRDEYRRLRGLIPICATCKKIRGEEGVWDPLESYLHQHAGVDFTHGICPDCAAAFREEPGLRNGRTTPS